MTMVCPSRRIGPNYLFIHVSAACDKRKSDCLRNDGVYLKSDKSGSEWVMWLWSEWLVALYAAVLVWNVLTLVWWPSLYSILAILGDSGYVHWSFGLGLTVWSSESRGHRVCWATPSICISIFCFKFWSVRLLVDSNVVNVCVSVQCEIVVFSMCILYCDV